MFSFASNGPKNPSHRRQKLIFLLSRVGQCHRRCYQCTIKRWQLTTYVHRSSIKKCRVSFSYYSPRREGLFWDKYSVCKDPIYVHTYPLLTFAYDEPFYASVLQWRHTFGRKIGNPMEKTRSPEESSISSKLPGEKKAVYLLATNINKNLRLRHIFRAVVGNLNPQFPT